MRNVISVFSMCHCPHRDGLGQIVGHPATQILIDDKCVNASGLIKAGFIGQLDIMAFASDPHIIISVIDKAGGTTCFMRGQCSDAGGQVALAFLAAETAAHAPDLNLNITV